MNELITRTATPADAAMLSPIVARVPIVVREGTLADVAFIDKLQKAHSRELGFLPTKAIEGKIKLGQVLIAEAGGGRRAAGGEEAEQSAVFSLPPAASRPLPALPVGYLIAADRYCKRDEIGYVTQINVLPEYRRSLVAAQLLQAQFDRSAYGCRLYSCWCAQDLAANEFWEAMGFTPIAFRTGARKKGVRGGGVRRKETAGDSSALTPHASNPSPSSSPSPRIHIFWQKRIRPDDTTTPWWYPAKTEGGEMREDRLVFPIPPGVHWRDVLPVVLPEDANRQVVADGESASRDEQAVEAATRRLADLTSRRKAAKKKSNEPVKYVRPPHVPKGMTWFAWESVPEQTGPTAEQIAAEEVAIADAKAAVARARKATQKKVDPRLVGMARELRDRWSEQADAILALPGKHDVKRTAIGNAEAHKRLAA